MADLSFVPPTRELEAELLRVVDAEGKIPAALEALGPVEGRDVVVLDAGRGFRAAQLAGYGARVTAWRAEPEALPAASADVVVACWSALDGPASPEIPAAERLLRPGGRLLLVHDYGRDDVCRLWPQAYARQLEWSARTGPYLTSGFRIRVIHCRWTFESAEAASRLLEATFGEAGRELAAGLTRPRLEYNIAVYHRSKPEADDPASAAAVTAVAVPPTG